MPKERQMHDVLDTHTMAKEIMALCDLGEYVLDRFLNTHPVDRRGQHILSLLEEITQPIYALKTIFDPPPD